MNFLEHGDSGHGSEDQGTVHSTESGSTACVTARALGLGVGSGNAGVDELALAEVLALDELLVLQLLVGFANRCHVLGGLEVEGTGNVVQLGSLNTVLISGCCGESIEQNLLGHVTAHVKGSTNALKFGESGSILETSVVGNLQVVADLGQEGERQVGELIIANNGKSLADLSQVGCGEGLETVLVQTEGAVQLLEGRQKDGSARAESQVGCPDQVGQLDLNGLVVVGEVEGVGNVAKLHLDLVDVAVVGNLQGGGLLDVDALKGAESGVLDVNLLGLLDGCSETDVLEVGKSVPLDGIDLLELGEVDGIEAGKAVQVHLSAELLEVAGADALDG